MVIFAPSFRFFLRICADFNNSASLSSMDVGTHKSTDLMGVNAAYSTLRSVVDDNRCTWVFFNARISKKILLFVISIQLSSITVPDHEIVGFFMWWVLSFSGTGKLMPFHAFILLTLAVFYDFMLVRLIHAKLRECARWNLFQRSAMVPFLFEEMPESALIR